MPRAIIHANHLDTPPMDVSFVVAGLLAHSSMLLSCLPDAFSGISGIFRQRLATYSCGGSPGIDASDSTSPDSLLVADQNRQNHYIQMYVSCWKASRNCQTNPDAYLRALSLMAGAFGCSLVC